MSSAKFSLLLLVVVRTTDTPIQFSDPSCRGWGDGEEEGGLHFIFLILIAGLSYERYFIKSLYLELFFRTLFA